jgi:mono/diheme cytochrome c family protein
MKSSNILLPILIFVAIPAFLHAQVDYEEDIQPIFNQNCTSCHGSQNGVTLSSYESVMSSVGSQYGTEIVVPNEPDESPLVDKIEPNPEFGVRMPQGGPYLSDEQINLIKTWISEGANEMPVSNEITESIPEGFQLNGNYPNPFNPQTIISFETPEQAQYRLEIYNSAGSLIQSTNGLARNGVNRVEILMQNQPSGTYFYRVKIIRDDENLWLGTQRMTLLK